MVYYLVALKFTINTKPDQTMKNKMKSRVYCQAFPLACFVILLLNINLDRNSLFAASSPPSKVFSWLSSIVDSSGNDLLSVSYILNSQVEIEQELQVEDWMTQTDSYQYADISDSYNNSSVIEEQYDFEDWMSNPESFLDNDNHDPAVDAVQEEGAITLEDWMINTSSWVEIPCQ